LPCRRHGLIRALAAGDDLQIVAANGFARLRKTRRTDDEICIERTNDKNSFGQGVILL
jgi:hypothetical protein